MATTDPAAPDGRVDFFIDITGDVCPMTFVRAKLLIERMASGQTAEIRLRGAEPLAKLPRAIAAQGHTVVAMAAEDPEDGDGAPADPHRPHRLRLRKA